MAKIEAKDCSPFINVTGKTPTDELDNTQKEALRVLTEYYEESLSGKKRDSDEYIVSLRPTNYTFVNDQKSGYLEIKIDNKNVKVHKLVALAFCENRYKNTDIRTEIHHKDRNRQNNNADNLEILSITEHHKKHNRKESKNNE